MDDLTLMALVAAAVVGLIASIMVLRHERQSDGVDGASVSVTVR